MTYQTRYLEKHYANLRTTHFFCHNQEPYEKWNLSHTPCVSLPALQWQTKSQQKLCAKSGQYKTSVNKSHNRKQSRYTLECKRKKKSGQKEASLFHFCQQSYNLKAAISGKQADGVAVVKGKYNCRASPAWCTFSRLLAPTVII